MEHGTIRIKLDELLEKQGMSKRKLCRMAELNWEQADGYIKNKVTRFDADVLARICSALDCELGDLLEFVPPQKTDDT